jgi:hypothetical protein
VRHEPLLQAVRSLPWRLVGVRALCEGPSTTVKSPQPNCTHRTLLSIISWLERESLIVCCVVHPQELPAPLPPLSHPAAEVAAWNPAGRSNP